MKNLLRTTKDKNRFLKKIGFTLDCWIWDAAKNAEGYGVFRLRGKGAMAHRVSFCMFNKREIQDGLVIDHLCKNRSCVNPYHLRETTQKQNLLNSESASTVNSKRKYCKHGHPLSGDNLKLNGSVRICKSCSRRRAAEWTKERRAREKNRKDEK